MNLGVYHIFWIRIGLSHDIHKLHKKVFKQASKKVPKKVPKKVTFNPDFQLVNPPKLGGLPPPRTPPPAIRYWQRTFHQSVIEKCDSLARFTIRCSKGVIHSHFSPSYDRQVWYTHFSLFDDRQFWHTHTFHYAMMENTSHNAWASGPELLVLHPIDQFSVQLHAKWLI